MTIVFSKLAQSRSKNNCIMQPCVNIFELRDLPAHTKCRSSDRDFVFIICIVQVVGIKLKIQPILSMSLSSWSFHVCHFKLRGGGTWLNGGVLILLWLTVC